VYSCTEILWGLYRAEYAWKLVRDLSVDANLSDNIFTQNTDLVGSDFQLTDIEGCIDN
jgi:hypothetical protein